MKNRNYTKKTQWIMGINPILEALKHDPAMVEEVYFVPSENQRDERREEIFKIIDKEKIKSASKGKNSLFEISKSQNHQGIIAKISPLNDYDLDVLLDKLDPEAPAFIFLVDSLSDPQNLGSLFRLAESFGFQGIIWSKNRGCDLTPTVSKASSGASFIIPYSRVSNLAQCIPTLQERGFYVAASAIAEDAKNAFIEEMPRRLALILGAEGEGIRPLLAKTADGKWKIPLKGNLQSMNVVQAACTFATLWRLKWG